MFRCCISTGTSSILSSDRKISNTSLTKLMQFLQRRNANMPNTDILDRYGIPRDAVITIGGTVGVGKSTIMLALAESLGFRTSLEKVDTNPYLDLFYHDFEKWSFHLQIYFL